MQRALTLSILPNGLIETVDGVETSYVGAGVDTLSGAVETDFKLGDQRLFRRSSIDRSGTYDYVLLPGDGRDAIGYSRCP